jgi:hypothetical protein
MRKLSIAGYGDFARRTAPRSALAKGRILPAHLVYVSTSGVFGNCGGLVKREVAQ